jgi:subtilisin family serine protease
MDGTCRGFGQALCAAAAILAMLLAVANASAAPGPDPLMAQQWALTQLVGIGIADAWTRSSGSGVVVAVLDTGMQADHPDLIGSLWTNAGEVPGNGRDDDRNGVVDDVHGANMLDGSSDIDDDNGHGTHVAGIIAAHRGNGIGGSGVAPDAKIMPVKVLDASLAGNVSALASGIRYAVDNGARILNVSVNSDQSTPELAAAVRYAGEHGATIVASSGNGARDLDLLPSYPAALPDPAVLSVSATTASGALWRQANLGWLSVDLAAPGEHILSTTRGSTYELMTGTSSAAPYVSGTLALMAAVRPDLSQPALRDVLLATSRHSLALAGLLSTGALDAGAAMRRLLPDPLGTPIAPDLGPAEHIPHDVAARAWHPQACRPLGVGGLALNGAKTAQKSDPCGARGT